MWSQWWVVQANDAQLAESQVRTALNRWTPIEAIPPSITEIRFHRGPDDILLAEAIAEDLALIRQTVIQSTRQELSRRLQQLTHRALGIPPREGWVVLDGSGPRSPRPTDCRGGTGVRWIVTVTWAGPKPDLG